MATGDQNDIISRLQRWLPTGWFLTGAGTRVYATLAGFAAVFAVIFSELQYVTLQTRVTTATDGFLDLASQDYFGSTLPRHLNESDANFSIRIRKEVLRRRVTRAALSQLIEDAVGAAPTIVETNRPADNGGFRATFYRVARYASYKYPLQVFIQTIPPVGTGIPTIPGFRAILDAYRAPLTVYCDPGMISGAGFTEAEVMAAINDTRAAGVTVWVWFTT